MFIVLQQISHIVVKMVVWRCGNLSILITVVGSGLYGWLAICRQVNHLDV